MKMIVNQQLKVENYEKLNYPLDNNKCITILNEQKECVLSWISTCNKVRSCVMNYVYDKNIWLTTTTMRSKYQAILSNPECSVAISSQGTSVIGPAAITLYGYIEVVNNQEAKTWFYKTLSNKLLHNDNLVNMLDSKNRVIMKLVENQTHTYDGIKMAKEVFL